MPWQSLASLALLLIALSPLTGCAAVPLATAGTLAGIAASGVSTGTDLYQAGKLDATDHAHPADVIKAARAAAEDLNLALKGTRVTPTTVRFVYADDLRSEIAVTIERRTETMTRSRIDVGAFGSEPTARLFRSRMRVHLPPVASADGLARTHAVEPSSDADLLQCTDAQGVSRSRQ